MKTIKKKWPVKGDFITPYYQVVLLARLYGRYLGKFTALKKQMTHFEEFKIPSAFDDALEFFKNKLALSKEEFKKLDAEARDAAFTIALDSRDTVLKKVQESIQNALASGQTIEDWKKDIMLVFDQLGVTEVNDYYLNMVFRTNTQQAYNRGKEEIFRQLDPEEFPMMEFVTVEDDRVRPEHAALHGFRAPVNDPIWKKLRPPLSYNCRCTVVPVHRDEGLEPSGWRPVLSGRGFEFVS